MEFVITLTIIIFLLSIIVLAFFKSRLKAYAIMVPMWTTISVVIYHLYTKASLISVQKEIATELSRVHEKEIVDSSFISKAVETLEFLMEDNFKTSIDFVIGLLGIVISVWVGLTIYNAVKKDELEKLAKKVDDEKESNKQIYIANLQRALDIEGTSSEYYSKQFYKMSEKNINHQVIGNIMVIETHFHRITNYYKENNYTAILGIVDYGFDLCDDFKRKLKNFSVDHVIEGYFYQRRGDFHYYKAMSEKFTQINYKKSVESALKFYKLAIKIDRNVNYMGYMDNTLGYLYLLLSECAQNAPKSEYLEQAKGYLLSACENKNGIYVNRGNKELYLYVKNLGCVYEKLGDFEKATEHYEQAIMLNPRDYKSRICAASLFLKKVQREWGITSDRKEPLYIMKHTLKQTSTVNENLKQAEKYLEIALKIEPTTIDAYYKMGQLVTYKYLNGDIDKDESKQKAEYYFEISEQLNTMFDAHKFHIRNYYETIEQIEKANVINNSLLPEGDSELISELYSNN